MRRLAIVFLFSLFLGNSLAQQAPPPAQVGFSEDMLDKGIDPCTDFYAYACRKWQDANPIPADQSGWGRFAELEERGEYAVRAILEKYSANDPTRTVVEQKIGDYYQSCMDESTIDKAGVLPLEDEFKKIDDLQSPQDLAQEVVRLHSRAVGALFTFGATQDFKVATLVIAQFYQGGIALPDRDYYLNRDAKTVEQRKRYLAHIQKMMELLGDPSPTAAREATVVLRIETELAKGELDRTSRRDLGKIYHKMTVQQLGELCPSFDWNIYLKDIGAPGGDLNIAEPAFFKHLDRILKSTPLSDWKIYLRWQVLHSSAAFLPAQFVNESFLFFDKELTGANQLAPRWKRCVRYTTDDLGEAVGEKYVEATFGVEGKQRTLKLVGELDKALAQDLNQLTWMSAGTRNQALLKLAAISGRIGYPDHWRDYTGLRVVRGDAVGNSLRANEFDFQRQVARIGKPVNKNDWPYPPSTVDASYDAQMNNITVPAGILQPPFYDNHSDDATNFGGIGALIGHEITHGFDDQGSQFDGEGNMRDWWTADDKKEFNRRKQCLADQYSGYAAVDNVKINGRLTLGENVADNGGLRLAYMALLDSLAGKEPPLVDGLTATQRFFLGWADVWCQNRSDSMSRMLVTVDPHSPGRWRVNGAVSNMPEFQEAFHCKPDAPMIRKKACRVW